MKNSPSKASPGIIRYGFLVLAISLFGLAGYTSYVIYPRFNLPAGSGGTLLALAIMAGVASFFSPCSFPLLMTLLARATRAEKGGRHFLPAMRFAGALSAGASLFLLLAGGALALGAGSIFVGVTFTSLTGRGIRTIVGIVLILFGLIQLGKLPNIFDQTWRVVAPLLKTQARMRQSNLAFGLYGFAYILAGFG